MTAVCEEGREVASANFHQILRRQAHLSISAAIDINTAYLGEKGLYSRGVVQ